MRCQRLPYVGGDQATEDARRECLRIEGQEVGKGGLKGKWHWTVLKPPGSVKDLDIAIE